MDIGSNHRDIQTELSRCTEGPMKNCALGSQQFHTGP